jgi:hypothetical protein
MTADHSKTLAAKAPPAGGIPARESPTTQFSRRFRMSKFLVLTSLPKIEVFLPRSHGGHGVKTEINPSPSPP